MTSAALEPDGFDMPGYDLPDLTDLHEVSDDEVEAVVHDLSERFRIYDDSSAAWAMRKCRQAVRRIDEIDRIAAEEIERIQSWAEAERRGPERDRLYFEGLLGDYARRMREEGRKSVRTPYGEVKTTSTQPTWTFQEDAFLAWAKVNLPDAVKIEEKVDKAVAKRSLIADLDDQMAVTPHGEAVPGVAITPPSVNVHVRPEVS